LAFPLAILAIPFAFFLHFYANYEVKRSKDGMPQSKTGRIKGTN
jgi:hypothetical protein